MPFDPIAKTVGIAKGAADAAANFTTKQPLPGEVQHQDMGTDLSQDIRNTLPEVDTSIDPTEFASGDIIPLEPPQDIDPTQIGDYTEWDATLGEVNPESTVEGRLEGLLSQNSPYIQRARTEAGQLANRRGMLNTSMAAGAAQGAAIDRALPIAERDAMTFFEQQLKNQGYSNDAAKYLAEQSVNREDLQAGIDQDTLTYNQDQQFETDKINAAEANKNNFEVLTADLLGQLKGIDNELAMNLETLSREYSIIENLDSVNGSIYKQMIADMGTILANEDKPEVARAKINALIAAAGVEFEFSSGQSVGGGSAGGGGIAPLPAPPPKPKKSGSGSNFQNNDRSCFTGDTLVCMASGPDKQIADVLEGDIVLGMGGEENTVTGIEIPIVGERDIFSFNDGKPFVTIEHPFMTSEGWKSLSPLKTKQETNDVETKLLMVGDYLEGLGSPLVKLEAIEKHQFDPETPVYNLLLAGNHTYFANGYLVHNKGGPGGGNSAGDGPGGGGDGPGGGDGGGCFSGDTCFLMADGNYKQIKDIQKGEVTAGGIVINTRNGPSDRDWYDYRGSKVTDEHFVNEGGVWMYVKDAKHAKRIDPIDTYYTMDTSDHRLIGRSDAIFSDDAVFDADDPIHEMPYGTEQWDLMLIRLNSEKLAA